MYVGWVHGARCVALTAHLGAFRSLAIPSTSTGCLTGLRCYFRFLEALHHVTEGNAARVMRNEHF